MKIGDWDGLTDVGSVNEAEEVEDCYGWDDVQVNLPSQAGLCFRVKCCGIIARAGVRQIVSKGVSESKLTARAIHVVHQHWTRSWQQEQSFHQTATPVARTSPSPSAVGNTSTGLPALNKSGVADLVPVEDCLGKASDQETWGSRLK